MGQPLTLQLRDDVITVGVVADGTDNEAFMSEARGMVGEVRGCATQTLVFAELVPEDLAKADGVFIELVHKDKDIQKSVMIL